VRDQASAYVLPSFLSTALATFITRTMPDSPAATRIAMALDVQLANNGEYLPQSRPGRSKNAPDKETIARQEKTRSRSRTTRATGGLEADDTEGARRSAAARRMAEAK
jgi:hypothetical protein